MVYCIMVHGYVDNYQTVLVGDTTLVVFSEHNGDGHGLCRVNMHACLMFLLGKK